MKTSYKILLSLVCAALVAAGIYWLKAPTSDVAAVSPQGATFSNSKFYSVAVNLANPGVNATSSAILNTDSNDRYVKTLGIACAGVGTSRTAYTGTALASLQLTVGTSSSNNGVNFLPAAGVASGLVISTSTPYFLLASSTLVTATSSYAIDWPANTYLLFNFNATNTAACTVGVETIPS